MKIHIVQKGDSLYEIAHAYGVALEDLMEMNQHLSDPNMLMPGMKIHIPANGEPVKQQTGKQRKEERKMEERAAEVTERRPRHHVEMDDHRPHKVPPSQERPSQSMMPQAMPETRGRQPMRPGPQTPDAMIYCCCCNHYHQMVPIQPFKENIQGSHPSHQPNLRSHQVEEAIEQQEKDSSHKKSEKPQERQSRVVNESYFTNDASFY